MTLTIGHVTLGKSHALLSVSSIEGVSNEGEGGMDS